MALQITVFLVFAALVSSGLSAMQYKVHIYTADDVNAGTNCNVMMRLSGTRGFTKQFNFENDVLGLKFKSGSVESFLIDIPENIGTIQSIKIGHDDTCWFSKSWKLEKVIIESENPLQKYEFSINKWLQSDEGRTTFVSTEKKITDCGATNAQPRVVNGERSKKGQWPWQVQLRLPKMVGHYCGGTLIHPEYVLTASHCVAEIIGSFYKLEIVLGEHNLKVNEGTEQVFQNNKLIAHPNWNSRKFDNDIALIKLSRPAMLNSNVKLACLPGRDEVISSGGKSCFVSGWGDVGAYRHGAIILKHAYLPSVGQSECKEKMAKINPRAPISENMLCGGGNQKSGCHGDSGGPYVCQNKENKFAVYGAVSWGSPKCDVNDAYTVFSRVTRYLDWIESYIYKAKYITKDKF